MAGALPCGQRGKGDEEVQPAHKSLRDLSEAVRLAQKMEQVLGEREVLLGAVPEPSGGRKATRSLR